MLKKFVISLMMVGLCFGCSNSVSIDEEKLSSEIVYALGIEEIVTKLDKKEVENLLYLDEGSLDSGILYLSVTNTSDMVGIFSCKNVKELKETVVNYIDELKVQNTNYFPEEVSKLEDALIIEKNNYIILVVGSNAKEAQSIIDNIK